MEKSIEPSRTKETVAVHLRSIDRQTGDSNDFVIDMGRTIENVRSVHLGDVVFNSSDQSHRTVERDYNDRIQFSEGVRVHVGTQDTNGLWGHQIRLNDSETITVPAWLNRVITPAQTDTTPDRTFMTRAPHGLAAYQTWPDRRLVRSVCMHTKTDIDFADSVQCTVTSSSAFNLTADAIDRLVDTHVNTVGEGYLHAGAYTREELASFLTHASATATFHVRDGTIVSDNATLSGPLAEMLRTIGYFEARLPAGFYSAWELAHQYRRALSYSIADVSHYASTSSPTIMIATDFAFRGPSGRLRVIAIRGGQYASPDCVAAAIQFQMNRMDPDGPWPDLSVATRSEDSLVDYRVTFDAGRFTFTETKGHDFELVFNHTDYVSIVPTAQSETDLASQLLGMRGTRRSIGGVITGDVVSIPSMTNDLTVNEDSWTSNLAADVYPSLYHRIAPVASTRTYDGYTQITTPATNTITNSLQMRDGGTLPAFAFAATPDVTHADSTVIVSRHIVEEGANTFRTTTVPLPSTTVGSIVRIRVDDYIQNAIVVENVTAVPSTAVALSSTSTTTTSVGRTRDGSAVRLRIASRLSGSTNIQSFTPVQRTLIEFGPKTTAHDLLGLTRATATSFTAPIFSLPRQYCLTPVPFVLLTMTGDTSIDQKNMYVLGRHGDKQEIPNVLAKIVLGTTFNYVRSQIYNTVTNRRCRWRRIRITLLTPDGRPFRTNGNEFNFSLVFAMENALRVIRNR